MNVQVTLNGSNISQHVIGYEREHKICTGVGMLELEVAYTIPHSFDPWDEIEIFENGKKTGQYFVSSASEGQPNSTISVTAQDNSKRLSDYFISDSYHIDYPSYTRFWIEYFLDEMGIDYQFLVSDSGSLLSNNTALGLMSGYEQIMMLLQMSGWYITFDYNGKARIGKANSDFGRKKGQVGARDIIDIATIKHDKMLRNRVVVWGKGDPEAGRWVFADVSRPTKWDYDKKDKRTIVISNANIRKTVDAFMLANKALLEFARITVEKHITLAEARDYVVGDVIGVRNLTWSGTGVVTTFGTSLSREGLVTKVILDERCPRLFGFFDIGGWVYVGTYGSGVWRKHILPSWSGGSGLIGFASGVFEASGWYDYSSGLMDMNVTDLHVNAGVLVSVTASGQAFYSLEDEHPWSGIPISGLTVSISGSPIPLKDGGVDTTVYSGLMARACIIDRDTNFLRVVVDTRSGENLGDFLMETDPMSPAYYESYGLLHPGSGFSGPVSGIDESSLRSWVLDVNPYDGIVYSSFPIGVSGNYDFYAFDIENDGSHDYVEAMTFGSGLMPYYLRSGFSSVYTNWGSDRISAQQFPTFKTSLPYSNSLEPSLQDPIPTVDYPFINRYCIQSEDLESAVFLEDNTPIGSAYIAGVYMFGAPNKRIVVKKMTLNPSSFGGLDSQEFIKTFDLYLWNCIHIRRLNLSTIRFYFLRGSSPNIPGSYVGLRVIDYDIDSDVAVDNTYDNVFKEFDESERFYMSEYTMSGGKLYAVGVLSTPDPLIAFRVYIFKLDLDSMHVQKIKILQTARIPGYPDVNGSINQYLSLIGITPHGYDDVQVLGAYLKVRSVQPSNYHFTYLRKFSRVGLYGSTTDEQIYDLSAEFGVSSNNDSTHESYAIIGSIWNLNDTSALMFFNVTRFIPVVRHMEWHVTHTHSYNDYDNPSPILTHYPGFRLLHAFDKPYGMLTTNSGGVLTQFDAKSLTPIRDITVPGYEVAAAGGVDSFNGEVYYRCRNTATSGTELISLSFDDKVTRRFPLDAPNQPTAPQSFRVVGNFRLYRTAGNLRRVIWYRQPDIYMKYPVYYLLQRDGNYFNPVKSGVFRERLDISNYAPILTMDRRVSSLEAIYVSMDGSAIGVSNPAMTTTISGATTVSGTVFNLGLLADDFRYTNVDQQVESGSYLSAFVLYSGAVNSIGLDTMDTISGLSISAISGYASRVETSNYAFPDQYMFVAVSGYAESGIMASEDEHETYGFGSGTWGFFQKDPESDVWVDYSSGYPQARTTIIRLDDRI